MQVTLKNKKSTSLLLSFQNSFHYLIVLFSNKLNWNSFLLLIYVVFFFWSLLIFAPKFAKFLLP